MAVSILIEFPISTAQYEKQYKLGIEMDYSVTLEAKIREDSAFVESGSTSGCLIFNGTLNGDTVIQTDGRDSIYDPLVSSKLKFNLVSHNFPEWLMEETAYYTDVRCVLALWYEPKEQWVEQWRGYLWGNTLNSRVVDDYISTPLFALDEIGMAKYLKPYNTIGQYGKSRRLWNYFAYYKSFNDSYFGKIYTFMEISYASDKIYWDSPYCLHDASNNELVDMLDILNFDSYGYVFQDEDTDKLTWHDLFYDVCQYLGVTFMVGSHGDNSNDAYLLETADPSTQMENYTRVQKNNESHTATTSSSTGTWTVITPNEKCNADFNITLEPAKYKGVKVKSEIKRYEAHEFLDDDNLDYYNKEKYVLKQWGVVGDNTGDTIARYCVNDPKYHKLYYMKPTTKEETYIMTKVANIDPNSNLYGLISSGFVVADLTAQDYDYPYSADNLSFILVHTGGALIKLGEFSQRENVEDDALENYLLLMNHKWQTFHLNSDSIMPYMVLEDQEAVSALTGNQHEAVELKPFGNHEIRHNNEEHFLRFEYDLMPIDENCGHLDRITEESPYHTTFMVMSDEVAMPSTTTVADYTDEGTTIGSVVGNYYDGEDIQGYAPLMKVNATIGNHYLTDRGNWTSTSGQSRGVNVQHYPDTYDKCVYAISAKTDYFGYKFTPYYNTLHPTNDTAKKKYLLSIGNYGGPNNPIDGVLDLKIMNPSICFDWEDTKYYKNNIYYLVNKMKFTFTDNAEIEGKPTEYEEMDVYDTLSKTKVMDELQFNLSTPQYAGLFYNCFQYNEDENKLISNAKKFYEQGSPLYGNSMEYWAVEYYANLVAPAPMQIDLTMRFDATTDANILYNNHVLLDDFTETPNKFEVREKTIYINRDLVKFKADRVYNDPWNEMAAKPNKPSHATLPINNNNYEV